MNRFSRKKFILFMAVLSVILLTGIFAGLFLGSVRISAGGIGEIISGTSGEAITQRLIILDIRLPRIILAIITGASLALSGAAFQGFFRNSLADPFVIGASSGAALGAGLAIVGGSAFFGIFSAPSLAAFCGSLTAVFLAFVISRTAGNPSPPAALLLAGTALGSFFSALLSLILVLHDRDLHRVYFWLLGSLGATSWSVIGAMLPAACISGAVIFLCARPLDLFLQGEEVAESLGVDVKKTRLVIALGASLASAAAVASSGIIGFVGLVAPHSVRMMTGPSHARLLPAAALMGAILVLWADIIARTVIAPMELPIGVICSLAGAPFFIYLMIRRGRNLGKFA